MGHCVLIPIFAYCLNSLLVVKSKQGKYDITDKWHTYMPFELWPWRRLGFFFSFIFISWRLITLHYCSGFCHTLTWISHGFTCVPHIEPASRLPLHPISLGLPRALTLSTCLMHPTWAGDLFHPWSNTCFNAILSEHPTLTFSHRVQKSILCICVSFSVLHLGLSLPSF